MVVDVDNGVSVDADNVNATSELGWNSVSVRSIDNIGNAEGSINCMFFNARSLLSGFKLEQMAMWALKYNLDATGVCETRLNQNISDSELSLQGFRIF